MQIAFLVHHHFHLVFHQHGKRVKTKSQKVFGADSYLCRGYRGKSGGEGLKFLYISKCVHHSLYRKLELIAMKKLEKFDFIVHL